MRCIGAGHRAGRVQVAPRSQGLVPDALSRLTDYEIERDAARRGRAASKPTDLTVSPDGPLAKAHKKTARVKK
jgi:hypothetical protein